MGSIPLARPAEDPDRLDRDSRETTLEIDPESVWVHEVRAVTIETNNAKVSRHRSVKREEDSEWPSVLEE